MKKILICLMLGLLTLTSCSVLQAVALKDCTYSYREVSDIQFLNMKQDEIVSFNGISAVTKALLGKTETVPWGMTVHINVTNPNNGTAALERLYYKVSLDSVQIADGQTEQSLVVVSGQTVDLPLKLSVDLKNALQSDKRAVLGKALKNVVGIGKEPTEIRVDLKPIFRFGSGLVASPAFIPVTFQYPDKKSEEKK